MRWLDSRGRAIRCAGADRDRASGGALLVEEAAFDLKAGGGRKARIARRFARTAFGPRAAIGPEPDPDHAEFDRLLGYAVIDT